MGDAAKADASLVPDFHWMDDARWAAAEGYHHVEADYRLLIDNLLDISHETFVHPETFEQDKIVLEAQQRAVDRVGSSDHCVGIKVSAWPIQGRCVLAAALQVASSQIGGNA